MGKDGQDIEHVMLLCYVSWMESSGQSLNGHRLVDMHTFEKNFGSDLECMSDY